MPVQGAQDQARPAWSSQPSAARHKVLVPDDCDGLQEDVGRRHWLWQRIPQQQGRCLGCPTGRGHAGACCWSGILAQVFFDMLFSFSWVDLLHGLSD